MDIAKYLPGNREFILLSLLIFPIAYRFLLYQTGKAASKFTSCMFDLGPFL